MPPKPIFFDPTGRRGRVLSAFAWVSGTISILTIVAFVLTLAVVDWPCKATRARRHSLKLPLPRDK